MPHSLVLAIAKKSSANYMRKTLSAT